jgi:hypothetical protein
MPTCPVCGDLLTPDVVVCALCGTSLLQDAQGNLAFPGEPFASDAVQWEIFDDSPIAASGPLPDPPATLPPACPVDVAHSSPLAVPVAAALEHAQRCLVLYGADKQPLHSFPLRKDITLIGRRDPMRGNFPDIDLAHWLGEFLARSVSRKHAMVLHTRSDDSFALRPLAGNTGTQIEQDMVEPLKDYPLKPGMRLILGGKVRLKFDIGS